MIFLEDYDMDVARYLVQGVDIWLNTPRRPMEASGTSGMKAAVNGVLNISTLDGWWCEGYTPDGGWIIGAGEEYDDLDYQDSVESQAVFNLLENEVVPLFYAHSKERLPRRWINRMKNTIKWCAPRFNTNRMVAEYTRRFYNPAAERWKYLTASAKARVKELSMWKKNVKKAWTDLSIENVEIQLEDEKDLCQLNVKQPQLKVGSQLRVAAQVRLGRLSHDDIAVEIYHGKIDSAGNIVSGEVVRMEYKGNGTEDGIGTFAGHIPCRISGQHGFALRILPKHPDLVEPYEPGMILWEAPKNP